MFPRSGNFESPGASPDALVPGDDLDRSIAVGLVTKEAPYSDRRPEATISKKVFYVKSCNLLRKDYSNSKMDESPSDSHLSPPHAKRGRQ